MASERTATTSDHELRPVPDPRFIFEAAFDAAPVGIAIVETEPGRRGIIRRANAALAQLLLTTPDKLAGTLSLDLMHPDDRLAAAQAVPAGPGRPILTTPRMIRTDGAVRWTEITTTIVRDETGRAEFMLAVVTDTSARRLAEERVGASEERFRTMVELSSDGIWALDAAGRVTFINPRMGDLLGRPVEDLIGRRADHLVSTQDAAVLQRALDRCRHTSHSRVEMRLVRPDGSEVAVIVSITAVMLGDGGYGGALATVTDISDRVEREREREQLHTARRLETVSKLAGGIAHDFNNLLGAIISCTDLIEPGPEDVEYMQIIRDAAEEAAGLTRQLQTFGRQDLAAPRPLDLREVLHEVDEQLRSALTSGTVLSISAPPEPCVVRGDRRQLAFVITNLALNAVEAMPEGGDLSIALARRGGAVVLRVTDSGVGMTDEVRERALEPFFTSKDDAHGGGLGLATVHGIVSDMAGSLHIDSAPGRGTTVEVVLPGAEPAGAGADTPGSTHGTTVLLVEDEPAVRTLTQRMLERSGYRVIACGDAPTALARPELAAGTVSVLLTDLSLPGMNGAQLAREVMSRVPGVGVVFVSGYTDDATAAAAVRDAEVVFVGKPFTGEQLLEGVRHAHPGHA